MCIVRCRIKFHHLAWNMGLITTCAMSVLGIIVVVMGSYNSPPSWVWIGLYAFVLGTCGAIAEFFFGQGRIDSRVPARAIAYFCASIYQFFAWPTALTGFCCLVTAAVNFGAAYTQEEVVPDPKDTPTSQLAALFGGCCTCCGCEKPPARPVSKYAPQAALAEADDEAAGGGDRSGFGAVCDFFASYVDTLRREGKVGRYVFYLVYFTINVFLWFYAFATFSSALAETPINSRLSGWIPPAKGFGYMLNMNCALIVVPMLRSMLRWLYNRSTQDHTWSSRALRNVLLFVPVDFSLAIHRMIAGYLFVAMLGHSVCHLLNWALVPAITLSVMGVWPLLSGVLLLAIAFFIYAAAFDNVKQTKFEYFWYTHHLFTAFFLICLLHGRGFIGPNFWKWFVVPGSLYLLERLFRTLKSKKDVTLLSVTLMKPNVMSLEFEKSGPFKHGYQEGQYLFLLCPAVSKHQWHPFTISSAPCEQTVTLHIRTWGEKSWTKKTCDYMTSMMAANATFARFTHMGAQGNQPGKVTGPDGQPLFSIDGPHAAPTQHAKEYKTVMIVGGGIGVTPLAATMKEIIFNRWKYSMGETFPNKASFYWMCAHSELDSFRWFMRCIKECDDEYCDLSAKNQSMISKHFDFHIFITSAAKERPAASVAIVDAPRADDEDHAIWGRHARREVQNEQMQRTAQSVGCGYTELDLFRACKLLPEPARKGEPIHMGLVQHVHVWNGRPNWDQQFAQVCGGTPEGEIGVTVCANPMICNDLEKHCANHSAPDEGRFVILHKENF